MSNIKLSSQLERSLWELEERLIRIHIELEGISGEETRYLHRFALICNIGASTRIENSVLTDQEIEWIDTVLTKDGKTTAFDQMKGFIEDKLSKDKERSIEEVAGCREVLKTIYHQADQFFPLTESTIRGLHHDLLCYHSGSAHHLGGYKTTQNKVVSKNLETREERVVLDPAPPGIITQTAMVDLTIWYNKMTGGSIKSNYPLPVPVLFIFRFLAIHPFTDGNGRLGRALFILALLQNGYKHWKSIVPLLAIDRHIEQNRPLYYSVLHKCSKGKFYQNPEKYEIEPLIWFFVKIIDSALDDIPVYRKRFVNLQKLSKTALIVLNCFKEKPENRLNASYIIKTTGIPLRTIQYSLKTLVEKEFLQRLGQGRGTRYQLVF
ncbi:MAG: Fic family protein [Desulfobacteraceae bacterium]|nr:Fic family protein [Desulfobacteraceae bacterium]